MAPFEGDTPRFHKGQWRGAFPATGFMPIEECEFAHTHHGSPEQVIVDRVLSVSFMASLNTHEKQTVASQIWDVIENTPELAGRQTVGFPYRTLAVSTRTLK